MIIELIGPSGAGKSTLARMVCDRLGGREHATVATIKSLLELGFPTELIARVLPCTGEAGTAGQDCGVLMARVTEIRDKMDAKAQRLLETRDTLTRFLAQAQQVA